MSEASVGVMGAAVFDPLPVTLIGRQVRLEPLGPQHADDLLVAGAFPELWAVTVQRPLDSAEAVSRYLADATRQAASGGEVPFAIVELATDRVIGSTRWMDITRAHRRVEIGSTWLTPRVQHTLVNTEAKTLQLTHLFEVLGAHRVQFKTDLRNTQSQRALEKLGAIREGVLRRHMVVRDGFVRDSVYYGITDLDWPGVKRRLLERLMAGGVSAPSRQD